MSRRTPAERALLDYLRADAWRFDDLAEVEAKFVGCIDGTDFTIFELNVLYEVLTLVPMVARVFEVTRDDDQPNGQTPRWIDAVLGGITVRTMKSYNKSMLPFQLLASIGGLRKAELHQENDDPYTARGMISLWREQLAEMRQTWRPWSLPESLPTLIAAAMVRMKGSAPGGVQPVITLTCEALMRMAWLFECEAMDALAFGPVSDRRLPTNPAEAAITLRRFAEQQPELRKVPAFIHVAPKLPDAWLRPRDYGRMAFPPFDREQTFQVIRDAVANRHYLHDHVAVIEVDRKPIKMIVLAPEHHDRSTGITYLDALIVHDKGTFVAEAHVLPPSDEIEIGCQLVLPFGSFAWRGMSDEARERHIADLMSTDGGPHRGELPADGAIVSLIIAAWRDLIVANVREQQYEATTIREEKQPKGRRAERRATRGHAKVVRYLPRMVVVRRAEESERLERTGSTRQLRRAFRVGTFARLLGEGQQRSLEASEFAEEIGMPLRDNQTIVRPHIRGGTPEEREALLAQDDVRMWRSWAAVDLLFATRVS